MSDTKLKNIIQTLYSVSLAIYAFVAIIGQHWAPVLKWSLWGLCLPVMLITGWFLYKMKTEAEKKQYRIFLFLIIALLLGGYLMFL